MMLPSKKWSSTVQFCFPRCAFLLYGPVLYFGTPSGLLRFGSIFYDYLLQRFGSVFCVPVVVLSRIVQFGTPSRLLRFGPIFYDVVLGV